MDATIVSRVRSADFCVSRTSPSRMTVMRSASSSDSSIACETKITPTPDARKSRTTSNRCIFSSGVSAAVGSSKMMMRALERSARAISTICFLAAPSVETYAAGSTGKFIDCSSCWAPMLSER